MLSMQLLISFYQYQFEKLNVCFIIYRIMKRIVVLIVTLGQPCPASDQRS